LRNYRSSTKYEFNCCDYFHAYWWFRNAFTAEQIGPRWQWECWGTVKSSSPRLSPACAPVGVEIGIIVLAGKLPLWGCSSASIITAARVPCLQQSQAAGWLDSMQTHFSTTHTRFVPSEMKLAQNEACKLLLLQLSGRNLQQKKTKFLSNWRSMIFYHRW